ncbi:reverse transcriptase domain-containing protein [Tanacetum coccineum]|uniref:Reverse transcriptase domain-containing protein n=1 Tax=Tanacetum coccineum TaxID=301880 RepID=A0ABQ5FWZ1_9ASTR
MYTRGRKKAETEPTPPARDPRDVEMIERLQQQIQELELRQLQQDSPTEEAESESNVWDDRPDDVNPFGKIIPRYHDRRYHLRRKVHPDDFIDWLSTYERVFDVRDSPNKLKVKLMAIKLRQHASLWWYHVTKRLRMKGKSKVETWEKMKKLMKAKFLPENHRQEAFLDYHYLSQWNMTVEEVINKFDKLHMRCDVVEEEEQVVARFLGVLKLEIADIAKSKGTTSRFTPPTRTTPTTTPKTTTPTTLAAGRGSNLFMKQTDFEGLMKTSPYVFTLVVVEENEIISEAPLQVQPLLREFVDVIPDDIPPGLPAMRYIQHCI